jgi:hypothetical protein
MNGGAPQFKSPWPTERLPLEHCMCICSKRASRSQRSLK